MANLGFEVSPTSVSNVLKAHGLDPGPEREKTGSWATFLAAHWEGLAATDFFTVEAWTPRGLVTFYVLFVIELSTRRVHMAGITPNPDGRWMAQVARNLTDCEEGFLFGKTHLIMDGDTKFTTQFRRMLKDSGVKPKVLPKASPDMNAYAERFVRSIKEQCLNKLIIFGEGMLRHAIREYLAWYHTERNHQGLDNKIIEPGEHVGQVAGKIECRERLGGMLRYYYREAA